MIKKSAKSEVEQLRAGWQRTQADFENYRKRIEQEKNSWSNRARLEIFEKLLPLLDNLDLAVKHKPRESSSQEWIDGVVLTVNQIDQVICDLGVEKINPSSKEAFDPRYHEAIAQEVLTGHKEGSITRVQMPGYKIGETVLRPARVIVAKGAQNAKDAT